MAMTNDPAEPAPETSVDDSEPRSGLRSLLWVPLMVAAIAGILAIFGR